MTSERAEGGKFLLGAQLPFLLFLFVSALILFRSVYCPRGQLLEVYIALFLYFVLLQLLLLRHVVLCYFLFLIWSP